MIELYVLPAPAHTKSPIFQTLNERKRSSMRASTAHDLRFQLFVPRKPSKRAIARPKWHEAVTSQVSWGMDTSSKIKHLPQFPSRSDSRNFTHNLVESTKQSTMTARSSSTSTY